MQLFQVSDPAQTQGAELLTEVDEKLKECGKHSLPNAKYYERNGEIRMVPICDRYVDLE